MTKERFSTLFDGYMRERKLSSRRLDAVTMVNRTTIDNWRKGNSLPQDPVQFLTVARAMRLVKCQVDELLSEASHQSIDFMNQPNAPQGIKDALEPWITGELFDGDMSLPTADASNQDNAPVSRSRHWVSWQGARVGLGILGIIGISVFIFWRNHGMANNARGITPPPTGDDRLLASAETIFVTLPATVSWFEVPLHLEPGNSIQIAYHAGEWTTKAGDADSPLVDARGYPRQVEWAKVPSANLGALIGRFGSEQPFEIGLKRGLRVPQPSTLFLQINDGNCDCLHDNGGSIQIEIRVER